MIHLTGDIGPTKVYTRREYAVLAGLDFGDGRAATVVMQHVKAQRRRGTKSWVSRYGVSEVKEIGFAGRAFVWDKELGEEEHGERESDRKPPYTVRLSAHGDIRCTCMAGACHAPTCRHCDMVLVLLDEGIFNETLQGA